MLENIAFNYFKLLVTNVILASDHHLVQGNTSLIECVDYCIGRKECRSLFHNSLNQKCFPSKSALTEATLTHASGEENGINYYVPALGSTSQRTDKACRKDSFQYSQLIGLCYRKSKQPKSWDGAKKSCAARDSSLFFVDNPSIHRFFQNTVNNGENAEGLYTWIGGYSKSLTWVWEDGRRIEDGTTYWHEGEPNWMFPLQNCMAYRLVDNMYKWDNGDCNTKANFYCQYKRG